MAPHCLYVCRGGKNKARGVWAVHPIESGVWFGPLEGDALPADKYNGPTRWHFAWEIYCGDGLCKLLIVKDGSKKDWLRHVTSTYVPWTGVNMAAYQFRGQIYYVTTKFIGQGQKLVLGLNHASYDGTSIDEKELSIRSKGFGVSMKCSLCHRQHDDTPVPARRGDWRSQAKNLDVQIDDCFPILKLSASEVHKQQLKREMHVVGRTKNSTTNGRRKFLNRLFRCHLCGWRFATFVRYASHKRNHELRYLKFRLQPCPKLSKQFGDDMMSPLKSDVNHSEYGFSMSDVHSPPTLTPVDEEARVKSAEAAIVSQRELNSTENLHDDCSELVQRGQKQEHLSNNEVGTDVKTKMPQKFEKQQENDIKRRHLRQRRLAAKCHEAPHRKQPASQKAKEKKGTKLNGGSNVVNGAGKSDRFTCTRCDKSFSSNANLKKHTRVHTGEKPFVCNYCGKRFTEISNLNTHLRVHTGHSPYKCTICGKKFKYLKGFKLHMSQHGRAPVTYKCSFCDREFSHKGPCKTHENSHQRERPFKCKICNMKFKREGGLQMHSEKMHPPSCHGVIRRKKPGRPKGSKNKKVDSKNMQEDRPHQCKRCGKAFKYNYSLRQHTRTHTGERPFKCTLCDAAFSQSSNLTSHRRIHTGEAPYKCRHCEKRFTCAQNLRSHLRVHTGERPYQCPQCPARFAYSSYLKTHSLVHSDRKPLRCSTCGKEYRHPTSFKIHLRTHSKK